MKTLILFIGSLVVLLLMDEIAYSQSKMAYINAGDECIQRNDPFCGINNYRLALEYEEDASLCFKIGSAEKLLHNYASSITWFQRCIAHQPEKEIKVKAFIEKADLQKRLGDFSSAYTSIDSLKQIDATQENTWNNLFLDYKNAEILASKKAWIEVYPESGDVNTAYSDFAPAALGDSLLYYSSLRYTLVEKNVKISTSRIASMKTDEASRAKSKILPESINMPAFNDANASISPDGKIMVFTRCLFDENGKLICALYESEFVNGKWKEAVKLSSEINPAGRTSTQPNITSNKSEGYLLFFASSKLGGLGGMDIWMSKRKSQNQYESPINLGKTVNTEKDEWSPFYDIEIDSLYYSTEKNEGLGGLDLYQIGFTSIEKNFAQCLPPPYNSGYNDLYYTRSYGENHQAFLVSNRPPAEKLNGSSCCYDIFRIQPIIPSIHTTSIQTNDSIIAFKDSSSLFENLPTEAKISSIKLNFPIRLYFDNDYPDPKSIRSNTDKEYDHLATNYLLRMNEYANQQPNDSLRNVIINFFNDSVALNFSKLREFTAQLFYLLSNSPTRLKITILGSASPLAERRYNLILSNRRIRSLENYWEKWEDDLFKKWINDKKLEIVFLPKGEDDADKSVSDQLKDTRKSIYSKEAAMERRIEIVDIEILP
ncbi:MAG: PD40 domain-containing protein [Bacteroidetes bacterium]|nr:PD40 domain-containing protein [Bacteroidota bacterium]